MKSRILTVLASAIVLMSAACGSETAGPSDPYELWASQSNQQIVFMSRADSPEGELYRIDKSGQVERLTFNARHENSPSLSRDGSMVAFQAGDESDMTSWEIYVLEITSGAETRITFNDFIDAHPDWGPGDSTLVFSSWHDSLGMPTPAADIFTIGSDGTGLHRLTDSPWEDNDPEWSHDGSMIVFKSNRISQLSAREEIFVMGADGSDPVRLSVTSGWESDHDPSWSPDDSHIVYSHYQGTRPWTDIANPDYLVAFWEELTPWNVCSVDLQGTSQQLTQVDYVASLPVFSLDGQSVMYLHQEFIIGSSDSLIGAHHRLYLIPSSGGYGQQLIPDDEHTPTMEFSDW